MCTSTKRLQSQSDAVPVVMEEIPALCDNTKGVMTNVTLLKNGSMSWKQNCAKVVNIRLLE